MLKITSFALLLTATACVDEPEPTYGEIESLAIGCPKWGCNENSPVMGPYKFHELHLPGGYVNGETPRVDGFWKDGKRYTPYMHDGAEFRAYGSNGTLLGKDLENGYLKLLTVQGDYKLIFKKVTPASESLVTFWVGTPTPIQTYELKYTKPAAAGDPTVEYRLCSNPPNRDSGEASAAPSWVWEAPLEAVLYGHERIDAGAKRVLHHGVSTATNGSMTIGCAGSALAKLHLTGHTFIAGNPSKDRMQAMLKMYVSDVCDTGHSFTDQGVPLHWQNANKTATLTGNEYAVEALWNADGALCLDVHRLGWKYDTTSQIEAACATKGKTLSACPTVDPSAPGLPGGAYLVSAVPKNPYPKIIWIPLF
jgi:hypothetical protein